MKPSDQYGLHIPTGEEIQAAKELKEELGLSNLLIDAEHDYPAPRYTLTLHGQGIAPLGNLCSISAEAGNGKTWLTTILCAASITDNEDGVCGIKRTKQLYSKDGQTKIEPRALYIDTEMEESDTALVQRRIHMLNGWDTRKNRYDRLRILNVRGLDMEQRRKTLIAAIKVWRPTAIFVDGIRDLLLDFNDIRESVKLITFLTTRAIDGDCVIWSVLHFNPGTEKMRGNFGTELTNKVSNALLIKREKAQNGDIYYDVSQNKERHKNVDGFRFRINDAIADPNHTDKDGRPLRYGIPELWDGLESNLPKTEEDRNEQAELYENLKKAFNGEPAMSKTDLRKKLGEIFDKNERGMAKFVDKGIALGMLEVMTLNKGRLRLISGWEPAPIEKESADDEKQLFKENDDETPF